jgi:hypothetical protein
MRKLVLLFSITTFALQAQSYPPAAGEPGSTAIPAESQLIVAWATGVEIERGYVDISNPDFEDNGSNFASYGEADDAVGPATNNVVSLGDAGEAILTFSKPISDGAGFDFAVFENSFSDSFLELAFVEVSSNGVDYFRFPSHSQTQTDIQVGGFGNLDPTYINNLAGKYRGLFGTPFDISELESDPLLNKNGITHVKIIDVVGSINPTYASYDSFGNAINDPFTTPFYSSGFDLDGVGVIHEQILGIDENESLSISIYPNPVIDELFVKAEQPVYTSIYDMHGRLIFSEENVGREPLDVSELRAGVYILSVNSEGNRSRLRFIKQ